MNTILTTAKNMRFMKKFKKFLTGFILCVIIKRLTDTDRYRSGRNEAVLKTVCPRGHVGSNPTLSASGDAPQQDSRFGFPGARTFFARVSGFLERRKR